MSLSIDTQISLEQVSTGKQSWGILRYKLTNMSEHAQRGYKVQRQQGLLLLLRKGKRVRYTTSEPPL